MSQQSPMVAPPTPDLFPRLRTLLYLVVLIAVGGFSVAESSPAFFLAAVAAAFVAWLVVDRAHGRPIPHLLINIVVLLATAYFFYLILLGDPEEALLNLGHFMIYILLAKLFERKTPRDITQILTLALLVLVTAAIFATSAAFAALVVIFALVSFYTLLVFQLRTASQRAQIDRLLPHAAVGRRAYRDLRRITFLALPLLVIVALIIFLATPRTNGQTLLSSLAPRASIESGYTNDVHLYNSGQLLLSDAVVMEVRLDQGGANIGSDVYQPYFRGQSYDSYNPVRHQWVRSDALNAASKTYWYRGTPTPLSDNDTSAEQEITQTYSMEVMPAGALFTLDDPLRFDSEQLSSISYCALDTSLTSMSNHRLPLRYTVVSRAIPRVLREEPTTQGSPSTTSRPERLESPFVTPGSLGTYQPFFNERTPSTVPPEITALAKTIAHNLLPADGSSPPEASVKPIADSFLSYLQTTYPYSLSLDAVNKNLDPTVDFLLNRKAIGGHCEVFASAMVMLSRAVGINARVVTGFHGGDFNNLGGFYIVRQLHAHAWTEVYLPNRGWTRYDPSPISSDRASSFDSFTKWFREFVQVAQQSWISNIISFDSSARATALASITALFDSATDALQQGVAWLLAHVRETLSPASHLALAQRLLRVVGSLAFLVLLALVARRLWRGRASLSTGSLWRSLNPRKRRKLAHDLLFFEDLLRLLRRTGVRRAPGQTPREYVDAIPALRAGAPEDADFLVSTFYAIRFGEASLTPEIRSQIATALQRVHLAIPPA